MLPQRMPQSSGPPSPLVNSKIHQINFNPYWHVPKSLVRQDLTKYMQENPNYLAEQNIFIYDGSGNKIDPQSINWAQRHVPEIVWTTHAGAFLK